jgi:hypothetical protein
VKTGVVQPVATEPSIGSEGGIGVVIHLSKTRKKRINISSIEQRQQTKTPNKPPRQNINSDFLFGLTMISQNPADLIWCEIKKNAQYKSDR